MRRIHRWQRLTLPGLTAILIGAGHPQQPPLVEVGKKGDMEALRALVVEEGVATSMRPRGMARRPYIG